MKAKTIFLVLAGIFFFNFLLFAAEPVTATSSVKEDKGYLAEGFKAVEHPTVSGNLNMAHETLSLVISLIVVIGFIYIVMVALKIFYVRASIPLRSEGIVKVLAKEYIDTKKTIFIVEVGSRILVLGSTDTNLNVLSEISDPAAIEQLKKDADEYIKKYQVRAEGKFSDELKNAYVKQGRKLLENGNNLVNKIKDKFKKGGEK